MKAYTSYGCSILLVLLYSHVNNAQTTTDVISTTTTTESLIDSVFDSIDTTTANAITSTTPKGCVTNLEGSSGKIMSKNFPEAYDHNTNCEWNINVEEGQKIKLTFHLFNVEHNLYCNYDWVRVKDSNGTIIKQICGYLEQDLVVYSTNNSMSIQFYTDSAVDGAGFLASYESIDENINTEDLFDENNKQGYVLSFPQAFTVNAETKQDQLCLQMLNLENDGKIKLSIYAAKNLISGEPVAEKEVTVQAGDGEIHCHHLEIPLPFNEHYAIIGIEGNIQGYQIYSFKSIRILQSQPLALIQTDKYDYRPKQDVYVRMVVMNEDLKPSKTIETVDELWIEDPSGSRLVQWKNLTLKKGLVQEKYKLPEETPLGKWSIKTEFNGIQKTSHFVVNENVLPTFEVTIKSPDFVLKDSQSEMVQVCAFYTHGAKVKGQANATFTTKYKKGTYWRAPYVHVNISKIMDLDSETGCAKIELNSEEINSLVSKSSPMNIFAQVKELATNEKQNATKNGITVKDTPFEITAGTSPNDYIISAFPYVGTFKIKDHAGLPRSDIDVKICSRLYTSLNKLRDYVTSNSHKFYSYNEEQYFGLAQKLQNIKYKEICQDAKSDVEGNIKLAVNLADIEVPENITKLSMEIFANDYPANETSGMRQPKMTQDISLTHSNASSALTIQAKSQKLSCGSNDITLFISAEQDTSIELTHFIASGGAILESKSTNVGIGNVDNVQKYMDGAMEIKFENDPESRIDTPKIILKEYNLNINRPLFSESFGVEEFKLLAYVRDGQTGDTLTADQDFDLEQCGKKPTAIKFSEEKVSPRSPISVQLKGPSEGYCGYSIVDKSVALVPNQNKVSTEKLSKLKKDLAKRKIVDDKVRGERCQDAKLLYKAFKKLGLFVLSDKLQFGTSCDTLVDVTDQINRKENDEIPPPIALEADYEYEESYASLAGGSQVAASFGVATTTTIAAFATTTYVPRPQASVAVRQPSPAADSFGAPAPPQSVLDGPRIQTKNSARPGSSPNNEILDIPQIELRNYFPETWLFDLADLDVDGNFALDINAPDTVTTWVGEAFCTSDETGIVVADAATFKVDQDFFVDLKMPYSIKRGEIFPINVTAFNKLSGTKLPLKIQILDSENVKDDGRVNEICLDPQDSQTEKFTIKAKELNEVNVTVEAKIESFDNCNYDTGDQIIADKVQKPIQVKPEGFPVEKVTSEFLCRQAGDDTTMVDLGQIELPDQDNLVEDSARAFISVTGDILAPSMNNLDNLVKMPYGCGEQNMISMVPNIYVVKYLKGTGQTVKLVQLFAKAKKYMESGYERQEKNYRHRDGSYSIWGPRDEDAEDINRRNLEKSQSWLNSKQDKETGCFKMDGFVVHSELAKESKVGLTASLLITMLESGDEELANLEVIDSAFRCLENNLSDNTTNYAKSLAAYAFSLKDSFTEKSTEILDELIQQANSAQPGKLFWTAKPNGIYITSQDVEMTAYNVLTLIKHERLPEALQAIKWLASQRNSKGGFKSTQDTMIALQAMAEYTLQITKSDNDLKLKVKAGEDFAYDITEENELLLQSDKLNLDPADLPKITAEVDGQGCFMVQNILRYNVKTSPDQKSFDLKVNPSNEDIKVIEVCLRYIGTESKTNMVVSEIEMLSGFEPQYENLDDLKSKLVKKVEYDEKIETLAFYFNDMPKEEHCLRIPVEEKIEIGERKPAIAKVYDYYNQEDIVSIEYNV